MAEAVRRGGAWVTCRLGCHECCEGPFEITPLDAKRIGEAWLSLRENDRAAAESMLARAREFQGGDEEPCPVLDRESGGCLLYQARPMICRTFGPAVMNADGSIAVCHLNYAGASDAEVLQCAVTPDAEGLEAELLEDPELSGWSTCGDVSTALLQADSTRDRPPAPPGQP